MHVYTQMQTKMHIYACTLAHTYIHITDRLLRLQLFKYSSTINN